jgi:two-component system LytT family sensor kinase
MHSRIARHLVFWSVYLFQDTLLHFTWMGPYLPNTSQQEQVFMAVKTALSTLVPKLILVYYLLYVGGKKIVSERTNKFLTVAEIIIIICFCLVIFRMLFYYYINPEVYHIKVIPQPLFNLRSTLISFLELGFVAGLAIALKSLRMQLRAKEREKNLVKEKLETELKFLRNQMNPHFLMNTLNNIYALARKKSDDTEEVVMKFSELLRFILYESSGQYILLTDEIKVLEDYIDLETIRYNSRLSVSFTKKMDNDSYQITPLILLSFVENAFKHGISESRFESFVHIEMRANKGYLNFSIENTNENGSSAVPMSNIGLSNVRRQLELTYSEYDLIVENKNNVFGVNLLINLNKHVEI